MVGLSGGLAGLKKEEKYLKKEDISGANETSTWQKSRKSIRRLMIERLGWIYPSYVITGGSECKVAL